MPGAMFEKAWNSGNLEFSDGILDVYYILLDVILVKSVIYNDFICGPLRPNVGEIDDSIQ